MDFTEHDVDELLRENEWELRRLAEASANLRHVSGKGESRSGLTSAVVDADGRLRSVTFSPRVLRLDTAALAEEVVQAVRQAQDDQDRQARELLAVPDAHTLGPAEIARQFEEFHEAFRTESADRNERLRRMAATDPRDA
ncbi:YbaB/EbfC family nucleoid-associated protein [Nonomuraea maritima]|uniref:YbaB/EbfC family nucleoid-associated protein n=1 Tax=Nonomuraea maritima TaxID=683260 RepID=UPI0037188C40